MNVLQAQLRAAVYAALSEKVDLSDPPYVNKRLTSFLARHPNEAVLMFSLVADVFESLSCKSSANVFASECFQDLRWTKRERGQLAETLGVEDVPGEFCEAFRKISVIYLYRIMLYSKFCTKFCSPTRRNYLGERGEL